MSMTNGGMSSPTSGGQSSDIASSYYQTDSFSTSGNPSDMQS